MANDSTPLLTRGELTVVAREIKIQGILEVKEEVHFFGQLFGEIKGHPGSVVYLKEGSLVEGKIIADQLIIEGFVKGEVISERVWITPHGRLAGSVKATNLQVDPGAVFEAKVRMS